MADPITITLYRWAGHWGPFKVKIPCGECTLTKDILLNVFDTELFGVPVKIIEKDWLSCWWEPLRHGAWHAPIVMVENQVISQGEALNRGVLIQAVIAHIAKKEPIRGNVIYGKAHCPFCVEAKQMLDRANIPYQYHDVVTSSEHLYRMIPAVKAMIGNKTPVTVPQIWLEDEYVGGATELKLWLEKEGAKRFPDNVIDIIDTQRHSQSH